MLGWRRRRKAKLNLEFWGMYLLSYSDLLRSQEVIVLRLWEIIFEEQHNNSGRSSNHSNSQATKTLGRNC